MQQLQMLPFLAVGLSALANTAGAHEDRLAQISAFFSSADVVSDAELVDCTLSGGTQTTCFAITVTPKPQDYTPGPWCPTHIDDTADAGGLWFSDGDMVDVDGDFIQSLAALYGDSKWQLYDAETGDVRYTGSLEACEAAARPDVDPEYQNSCVQCLPEYMPDDASMTYVIPIEPVMMDHPSRRIMGGAGVAYNGVRLDGPAPVDAILGAYTIAPFDDCGGHVNLHVGYHYHAVTDCLTTELPSSGPATDIAIATSEHGAQIGIAMDGHQIFPHLMADRHAPDGLDTCNGHEAGALGYHYHAGAPGSNAILGCHVAEVGCVNEGDSKICDASKRPPRP